MPEDGNHAALIEFGFGSKGSGSVSLILGPPGTGMAQTIYHFIGALMHHSVVGHYIVGATHPTVLLKPDSSVRMSYNPHGIRILVCAGTNAAVDNIEERLKEGLSMSNDRSATLIPCMACIVRHIYHFKDLIDVSLQRRALQCDDELYHPDQQGKNIFPSSKALKQLGLEVSVVLSTNSPVEAPF